PIIYPVMWARDAASSFLRPPAEMRALIEAVGFRAQAWDDVTPEPAGPTAPAPTPAHSAQRLIMGERLEEIIRVGHRNRGEGRLLSAQAIFDRPWYARGARSD